MSEWWTYRLHSFLMFSPRTYFRTVEAYNAETWPAHLFAVAAAFALVVLAERGTAPRLLALILSAAWLWVAWAFLWQRYSPIFLAGPWLAAAFAVQGIALGWVGFKGQRAPREDPRMRSSLASLLVFAGVIVFPPFTAAFHPPRVQLFGTMPDPTALATLGLLVGGALPVEGRRRWLLAIIPTLAVMVGALTWWAMLE